jgi:hypothetical protein
MKLHLENKPWTLAVIGAAGTTLLLPSAAALFAPPEFLDGLILLGDARLLLALAGWFAASSCALRVLLRRRRLPEEEVDVEPAVAPVRERAVSSRAYLR